MDTLTQLFGDGEHLNILQMSDRGVVMFLVALLLIRISGRRSFGVRTPLDNIIAISLGAIMSRGVVGASPYVPVIVCCLVIVLLHRLFGWLIAASTSFGRFVEGDKIVLFEKGKFNEAHMRSGLVCREDIMQGVRKSALTEDMETIEKVYMERNGEISSIKK